MRQAATETERVESGVATPDSSSRFKRPQPHPEHSGTVQCLYCGNSFVSWDRTRNRLCTTCAKRG